MTLVTEKGERVELEATASSRTDIRCMRKRPVGQRFLFASICSKQKESACAHSRSLYFADTSEGMPDEIRECLTDSTIQPSSLLGRSHDATSNQDAVDRN